MEPIIVLAAQQVEELIRRYEDVTNRLIEAEKELASLKDDRYVTWEWVCEFFSVTKPTAEAMLANEKLFVYGRKVKRLKKSAILKFAERNSI